jgi:excisionase family DNA binding protein
MTQKYYTVEETAKLLGVTPAEVNRLREQRELFGVNTGVSWKFKVEDVEKLARDRQSGDSADDQGSGDEDVLLSEAELGESDPSKSGTVIGSGRGLKPSESDIQLAGSDVGLAGSSLDFVEGKPSAGGKAGKDKGDKPKSGGSALDLTLDEDLSLEDSQAAPADKPSSGGAAKSPSGGSAVDLAAKDDDVLGGSGSGSDITIGGDSGISLVDPADSGLSLEDPLDLVAGGDESLELGEDDMLSMGEGAEAGSPAPGKTDDDFLLTPMEEEGGDADSESGSQVIALDTGAPADDSAATMIGSASSPGGMAAMLDEEASPDGGMGFTPAQPLSLAVPGGAAPLGAPPAMMVDQASLAAGMALPEAPYSIWNILGLSACVIGLVMGGMMAFDLVRNMWSWDGPMNINSSLMDTVLGWFEG